jgi:hypothetical protein
MAGDVRRVGDGVASVLLLVLGLALAGCGSGPAPTVAMPSPTSAVQAPTSALNPAPTVTMQPALDTAIAFIQAIGDSALVDSYMVPSRRSSGDLAAPTPPPGEIQDVRCVASSVPLLAPDQVVVRCSWTYRDDWDGIQAGSSGSEYIWLTPQPDGTWLVYGYGN